MTIDGCTYYFEQCTKKFGCAGSCGYVPPSVEKSIILMRVFYISWAKQAKIQISLHLIFSELKKTITDSNVTAATAWKVKIGT